MKKLLAFLLFVLLVFGGNMSCKKKEADNETKADTNILTNVLNAECGAVNTLYQYGADHPTADPADALVAIIPVLKTMEGISDVTLYDHSCLLLTLNSGLKCAINMQFKNADSTTLTRGGGAQGVQGFMLSDPTLGPVSIKNKNILFYSPPFNSFYSSNSFNTLSDLATKSSSGATFTTVLGNDCKPSTIRKFKDYGLVMMSTHGFSFGFMSGLLNFYDFFADSVKPNGVITVVKRAVRTESELKQIIESANEAGTYDLLSDNRFVFSLTISVKIGANYNEWYKKIKGITKHSCVLIATTKYIESLPDFDNTVILANNCHSGTGNDGNRDANGFLAIRDAMLMKLPGAYFGWVLSGNTSRAIENEDAIQAERQFIKNLLYKLDTTGRASYDDAGQALLTARSIKNTVYTGENCSLKIFGQENIWFGCGASFTDSRDGNVYKTVCINNRQWMAENLRYNAAGSAVYNGDNAYLSTYGRLYTVDMIMNGAQATNAVPSKVQGICPKGWHVPSAGEFDTMINSIGGFSAGAKLKSTDLWSTGLGGTNETGFNALPAGSYSYPNGYLGSGTITYFRSSSTGSTQSQGMITYSLSGAAGSISKTNYGVNVVGGLPWYVSCRCVKDY